MSLEGHVEIVLPQDPAGSAQVRLAEPADVTGLLSGRGGEDVVKLIPALYALCGTAHAAAACAALESASGFRPDDQTRRTRTCLVLMERIREHILRVTLDWPAFIGEAPDRNTARAAMPLLAGLKAVIDPHREAFLPGAATVFDAHGACEVIDQAERLIGDQIFNETPQGWLGRGGPSAIGQWAKTRTTIASRVIDELSSGRGKDLGAVEPVYLSEFESSHSIAPEGRGSDPCPETSPLDRRRSHPFLASSGKPSVMDRHIARLIDLAATLLELRRMVLDRTVEPHMPGPVRSEGIGMVETARGRLTHQVSMHRGAVKTYRIVSPTRWNFAAGGIAERCLNTLRGAAPDDRVTCASLIVAAIDPCVAHSVRGH
ncbi:MAG: nickel-dependent hydrogenase large subunit [Roseibium sp.]|nr:nickel-dependent hydrogenase large subunit [Roseibium sp.]